MEIPRVVVRFAGLQPPPWVTGPRVFDLHHLGAEPSEAFGARRSGLELGEVHDANAFERIEFDANAHRWPLPLQSNDNGKAYHSGGVHTTRADAAVEILQID